MSDEIDLEQEQILHALSEEELQGYLKTLIFFLDHQTDPDTVFNVTSNSIDMDEIAKLSTYEDQQIPVLHKIVEVLKLAIPIIRDPTIKQLLESNLEKVTKFLEGIDTTTPAKYPNPDCKKLALNEHDPRIQRDDVFQQLAENIKTVHENPYGSNREVTKFDKMLSEGLQRFRELRDQKVKLARDIRVQQKPVELSDRQQLDEILLKIADRLSREGMHK
ncbi:MAG: hypothetical protein ABR962_10530 [Candidatus Bathyarchaeia archaeon]|jgi:hypothetical protein